MASTSDNTDLSLAAQKLDAVPADFIAKYGATATKLDLSSNNIKPGDWIGKFPKLKTLVLDHNNISSLSGFTKHTSLDTLWVNNNNISDLRSTMDVLEKTFPELTYLSILRNPMTPDMYSSECEADAYQRFRWYAIHRLKKLQFLDASPVDPVEKKEADRIGHLMAPAKPTTGAAGAGGDDDGKADSSKDTGAYSQRAHLDNKDVKVATFLVKSKPRYDGSNSEGNRFITNDVL